MAKPSKTYRKRQIGERAIAPETLMMSYGFDPVLSEGAIKPPIFESSTFVFRTAEEGKAAFELISGKRERGVGEDPNLVYSRMNNPNLEVLEDRLALWDEADDALAFSSGMSAIATALFTHLSPGDTVLYSEPIYGGTEGLFRKVLSRFGIAALPFEAGPGDKAMKAAFKGARKGSRLGAIMIETPANPTNSLIDIAAAAEFARSLQIKHGGERPIVMVDNTFLGPLWQHPLKHGADLVLYSLTKYVGGHSDLIAGAAVGTDRAIAPMRRLRTTMGAMAHAHTCWLLLRSMETLKIRMEAAARSAQTVAEYLRAHPKVAAVHYLGFLEKGPMKALYKRQCGAAGSTFSFVLHGGEAEAFRVLNALSIIKLAVSLGGTETLMSHPASTTHSDVPPGDLTRWGVTPGLIRVSIGLENPLDLIADLEQALRAA